MARFSRDDNVGIEERIEARKPASKRNTQKDKRNKKKGTAKSTITEKRYSVVGSVITLAAGQDNPANKLTSDLIGATITITNPHQLVDTNEYPTSRYTLPTTYSTKISNVINETSFELAEPYFVTDNNGDKIPVSLKKATNNASITYDTFRTETENSVFQRSFANLTVGNLRTFSGDVYKAKVYTRDAHSSTDFEEIFDTFVVPENSLVNGSSVNGFENIGFFHTGSIVANNWVSSSTTSNEAATFVSLDNTKLIDGLLISGSTNTLDKKVTFRTSSSIDLEKDVDYVLRFNSYFFKSIGERKDKDDTISTANHASLKIFISGSAITGASGEEDYFLGEVDVPDSSADQGEIKNVIGRFTSAGSGSPKAWIKFELNSGRFVIQDVSLEPFNETNFNPSFFKALAPMPRAVRRGDKYDFLVEFYDSNNNLAETTAQVNGITFAGPRQVLADGLDAKLSGSLLIGESVEMYGTNPAFIRSVGYNGFDKTTDSSSDRERNGGFLLWSGSIGNGAAGGNRISASEAYNGVGLEIVDASAAAKADHRFFQFASNYKNTGNSRFRVQTNEFLLGVSGSTKNYISGSNGNLEISSSNFTLSSSGQVILTGTITAAAGGTIGGFTIGSTAISIGNTSSDNNFVSIDSGNRKIRIGQKTSLTDNKNGIHIGADGIALGQDSPFKVEDDGTLTASQGTIGGFTITSTELFSLDSGTPDSSPNNGITIDTTGGSNSKAVIKVFDGTTENAALGNFASNKFGIKAIEGEIGGFEINSTEIKTSDFAPGVKGLRLTSADNGKLEVEEAVIRGTLRTTVFEKESVNAVGGQLLIANSTTITGSQQVGTGDTKIQVANASGFVADEFIIAKKFNASGFTTEIMKITNVSRVDASSDTNFSGSITVLRAQGTSDPGTNSPQGVPDEQVLLGKTGGSGASAQTYEPGQVLVSTGKNNTGFIKLNANPNDTDTPYMDIVERNGTGVYDMDLKARIGDLSGISDTINGQAVSGFGLYTDNAFLKGGIVASYGSIGAFNISSTGLNSDSGEFQVTGSTGQITGSKVLFDGGKVGNFNMDSTTLFSDSKEFVITGSTGQITGSNVLFSGGKVGGWEIGSSTLTGGVVTLNSAGSIKVGSLANASTTATTNSGFFVDADGNLLIKADDNDNNYIKFDVDGGTSALQIKTAEFSVVGGNATFSGNLSAAGGTFAGQLTIGGSDIDLTSGDLKTALSLNNVDNTDDQGTTQGGLIDGVTITGGGITVGSGGVIKSSGKDSVTDTTAGFFLGRAGSSYDFAVGDANNNIKFDGDAGDFQISSSKFGLNAVSSNIGINMNSLDATIIAQSGSKDTAVKVFAAAGTHGGGGALQVSQSGIPLLKAGGAETQIFSSLENMSMGSLPLQVEDQVFDVSDDAAVASASTQLGSTIVLLSDRPSFAEVENIQDAVAADTGIPTVRMATAIVQSHFSASKVNAAQSLFLKNTRDGSTKNTKFKVFLQDNKASGSVKNIPVGLDVRKTYGSATAEFGSADFVHQTFAFNSVHTSNNANTAFKASSNNSGSAIFHLQETLIESANDKFQDGAFCLMRLDADTSDLQKREHRQEFVFLEMRESTGSSADSSANGPATQNRVFQVQSSGSVVANGNITAFGSTFMNVSDERLKENVYDVSGSLNKILELRPTHFTWKENKKQDVGFIAQEVEEIIPEVIETSKGFLDTEGHQENEIKDMKTIAYPKLIPYLVDTIQVMEKRIKELEKKVK